MESRELYNGQSKSHEGHAFAAKIVAVSMSLGRLSPDN